MGKATELDDTIRPLSATEIAARRAAMEIADEDVVATLDGRLVKKPKPTEAPRVVMPAPRQTWD